MWGDNLLLSLKLRWVTALTWKDSEISSFCRGRIAGARPPHSISPLSFYEVIKALNASSYFRPPQDKRKKKDEIIKSPCAPARCYWNLKCFPFQEKMSRGHAIRYLSCKDFPGVRTVPHTTKCCWDHEAGWRTWPFCYGIRGDRGNSCYCKAEDRYKLRPGPTVVWA